MLPPSANQTRMQLLDEQNTYDYSFVRRSVEASRLSQVDQESVRKYRRRMTVKSEELDDDAASSVIESDSSIASRLDQYRLKGKARQSLSQMKQYKGNSRNQRRK